jgi:hypothetical protein
MIHRSSFNLSKFIKLSQAVSGHWVNLEPLIFFFKHHPRKEEIHHHVTNLVSYGLRFGRHIENYYFGRDHDRHHGYITWHNNNSVKPKIVLRILFSDDDTVNVIRYMKVNPHEVTRDELSIALDQLDKTLESHGLTLAESKDNPNGELERFSREAAG